MQFIGITGHRGSGKTSVGYLLGNMLNAIHKGTEIEDIETDNENIIVYGRPSDFYEIKETDCFVALSRNGNGNYTHVYWG